ncbi:MAG: T9SS type A sorting domain-containing protein, partial [Bacteroidales bacterium]|nr:T9SS type A sorting domain-containing protein [Bacteroidales bacterium]
VSSYSAHTIDITSNEVQINVNPVGLSIATGTISGSPFAVTASESASVSVPYTIAGTFNAGNVFTAYLSDASGNFASSIPIGTLASTADGTITANIPAGTPSGNAYRIRVESDNPVVVGIDNGEDLTITLVSSTEILSTNNTLNLYPNPSNGNVYIDNTGEYYNFEVYNAIGQMVFAIESYESKVLLDLNGLKEGLYIVNCISPTDVKVIKFILK